MMRSLFMIQMLNISVCIIINAIVFFIDHHVPCDLQWRVPWFSSLCLHNSWILFNSLKTSLTTHLTRFHGRWFSSLCLDTIWLLLDSLKTSETTSLTSFPTRLTQRKSHDFWRLKTRSSVTKKEQCMAT